MNPPHWTYDKVTNTEGMVVALCYHISDSENCLSKDTVQLLTEGLGISCAKTFLTLQEAKAHAWLEKDKFVKGLD